MKLYHRTSKEAAARILAEGFRDGEGYYATAGDRNGNPWRGVFLCDRPWDVDDRGPVVLVLSIPDDTVADWAWEAWRWAWEDACREFLVPGEIVNRYGPPSVKGRAPRRWTSVELLLRNDEDEETADWARYESVPGGRTEPAAGHGHKETAAGEWRDGERVVEDVFSPCGAERPVTEDRREFPHRGGGVG